MKTVIILALVCSAVLLCLIGCNAKDNPEHTGMPDPEHIRRQKTVEKVNIVYGTEKAPITLRKPDNAYFTVSPELALKAVDRVWLKANDSSWSAEVFSAVYSENNAQNEAFVEYYYKGELCDSDENLEYFRQEVTDLGITYINMPVRRITSTYKRVNENDTYEACFVGFEFDDTSDRSELLGKGLMGFKIYSTKREFSDSFIKGLFTELFSYER